MNLIVRLFAVSLILVLFTVAAFADDEYYSGQVVYILSDHWIEAGVDHHFDTILEGEGLSPSLNIFPDKQDMKRYGAIITKGHKDDEGRFIEYGVFVDANGKIIGHSKYGAIHVRRDSIAVFSMVGYERWGVSGAIGPYAMGTQVDVQSYVHDGAGGVHSYDDKINEFSTGLAARIGYKVNKTFSVNCSIFKGVDNVNTTGTDNVKACGVRYEF